MDEHLENLFKALNRLDEEKENEALKEWVNNICAPENGVIDGLVANFIEFVDDKAFSRRILKILKYAVFVNIIFRKANEHIPGICLPQICSNIFFPGALVNYLEKTDLEDLAGDAFILLVNIFDEKSVKEAT